MLVRVAGLNKNPVVVSSAIQITASLLTFLAPGHPLGQGINSVRGGSGLAIQCNMPIRQGSILCKGMGGRPTLRHHLREVGGGRRAGHGAVGRRVERGRRRQRAACRRGRQIRPAPAGAGSGAPADTSGDACAEVAPVLRSSVAVGAATDSEQTDRAQVNPCQTAATQLKNSIGGLANHM